MHYVHSWTSCASTVNRTEILNSDQRRLEGDYGSGKSFIISPVAVYFLWVLGNDDVIYEVIYSVIL